MLFLERVKLLVELYYRYMVLSPPESEFIL